MNYKALAVLISSLSLSPFASGYAEMDTYTPLMEAIAREESPEKIALMIAEGADVKEIDSEFLRRYNPVLRYALDRGTDPKSVAIIKMLIDAGANVNEKTYNRTNDTVQDIRVYGFMPLLTYAVIYSSAQVVQLFIDAGAQDKVLDLNDSMCFKKTALEIAQELKRTDIVKILKTGKVKA